MKQPSLDKRHHAPDVLIAGGGIIGLSLALELERRGARVTVLERDRAVAHASTAAAGMLALRDPHNPPALYPLARYSAALYAQYLARLQELGGVTVPFQTESTVQYAADGSSARLAEFSLDPRQLAVALRAAVLASNIALQEGVSFRFVEEWPRGWHAVTASDERFQADKFVIATGAWMDLPHLQNVPVRPRKGQMLRLALPPELRNLHEVHRSGEIYIAPRTHGPQAGSALIGATIEDAGFDTTTHADSLAGLRSRASQLLPAFASEADAPMLDAWAGLRPATPDELPVLGEIERDSYLAAGHYRNGILLAPATAMVLADLVEGQSPMIDITPYTPGRFAVPQ